MTRRSASALTEQYSPLVQFLSLLLAAGFSATPILAAAQTVTQAQNPIIWADVPDVAMVRVGDTYYMSSTTMHMSPGLPIMKSKDLVNWELVSYAYEILDDIDELNLNNGKNSYGRGSWASSIRHHKGTYYVSTFAQTTGRTYIYSTKDIEKGPWKVSSFKPSLHDHSLFFDDDDRIYMLYGVGNLRLVELAEDLTGLKPGGFNQVVVTNASAIAGTNINLQAEGSQLLKVNGKYFLFNITWPRGGMRTVLVHRADKITGPYEGRLALQDKGVAQGCIIDTPNGDWYAYLFRDFGAVGRIPYLVPVKWSPDGWPVLGVDGKVPDSLDLPPNKSLLPDIVASDEFDRKSGEPALPLVWQWNHNPDNSLWSITKRPGHVRLATGRTDTNFLSARNTLTQRTFGPQCSASTAIDVSNMKDGDFAGLALLQKNYGLVGVKREGETHFIVMVNAQSGSPIEVERVPLNQKTVFLKAEGDFKNRADKARFFHSSDGRSWAAIGTELKMSYTLPHFMGYRFGLFNYATKTSGGFADFDYLRVSDVSHTTNHINHPTSL
jgi:beta-xylosidase